jgi:primosomal protein N' (replication factor Y)
MVGFVSDNHRSVIMSSNNFMKRLVALAKTDYSDIPLRILGPSPAAIAKISNKYRYKIIIKCRNDKRFRSLLSAVISEFNSNKENRNTTAYIDMNALSF